MAAVRHLGFVTSSYRTTHEVYSLGYIGLLNFNFMLMRFIVLKIWRFEFIADLALMPIHAPKFRFLGVWTPKRDWSSSRPPKGTSLAETALTCRFWWRSVKRCDLGAWWRNQKRREKKLTVANCVFAQTTHVDAAMCGLACRVVHGR